MSEEPAVYSTETGVRYVLPLPPRGSGSNARGRWSKARAAREYRAECADAYRNQGVPADAPWELVHVTVEMRVTRKRLPRVHPGPAGRINGITWDVWQRSLDRYRPDDAGNVHDACKAAIDALQPHRERHALTSGRVTVQHGAGVVVSDSGKYMTFGAPVLREVGVFEDEGVVVTVERRDA